MGSRSLQEDMSLLRRPNDMIQALLAGAPPPPSRAGSASSSVSTSSERPAYQTRQSPAPPPVPSRTTAAGAIRDDVGSKTTSTAPPGQNAAVDDLASRFSKSLSPSTKSRFQTMVVSNGLDAAAKSQPSGSMQGKALGAVGGLYKKNPEMGNKLINKGVETYQKNPEAANRFVANATGQKPPFPVRTPFKETPTESPAPVPPQRKMPPIPPKRNDLKAPAPAPKPKLNIPLRAPLPTPSPRLEIPERTLSASPAPPVPHASKPRPNLATKPSSGPTTPAPTPAPAPVLKPGVLSMYAGHQSAHDLDLQLHTGWFASNPPGTPPVLQSMAGKFHHTMAASAQGMRGRMEWTLVMALQYTTDLSRTWIRVKWLENDPAGTARAEQRHEGPPPLLSREYLVQSSEYYGPQVVEWCQSRIGTQVSRGECWDVANEALKAVAAECPEAPCMTSAGTVHGHPIYETTDRGEIWAADNVIRPGDVLQFLTAQFEVREGSGRVVMRSTAGAPDHTSVVTRYDPNTGICEVLEQNVGGVRKVQKGTVHLRSRVAGEVRAYRPIRADWAGRLEAKW
ncbi:hypothetical protein G7K_6120-t1 [Saitoella complicata NRRL Y-17804]|uniref:BBC1/AIM3 cysteine proteinase-fold domain-containing protein n=2 Tax=Saitoella complicata (strain BCRC 22490 / CBS 7301 / JCM 7358 / NBRC 10748 / NRRL Y-17804) TaxID=698492 RepID=A0A0E9NQ84_SAICN|nr:hypothetical protein G7K_6120-t1 [Saitoella complicata NRRL Y-17804]